MLIEELKPKLRGLFKESESDAEGYFWDSYGVQDRYFDPVVGQFISEDPTRESSGESNLFAYVKNNPINELDPSGHDANSDAQKKAEQAREAAEKERKAAADAQRRALENKPSAPVAKVPPSSPTKQAVQQGKEDTVVPTPKPEASKVGPAEQAGHAAAAKEGEAATAQTGSASASSDSSGIWSTGWNQVKSAVGETVEIAKVMGQIANAVIPPSVKRDIALVSDVVASPTAAATEVVPTLRLAGAVTHDVADIGLHATETVIKNNLGVGQDPSEHLTGPGAFGVNLGNKISQAQGAIEMAGGMWVAKKGVEGMGGSVAGGPESLIGDAIISLAGVGVVLHGAAVEGHALSQPVAKGSGSSTTELFSTGNKEGGTDGKGDAAENPAGTKTYQTYTKTNSETGEVYSGRTSGTGTPEENVYNRDQGHHMNDKGFGPAVLDKSSANPDAIRGREQQLIDANGGAKSGGGTSGNQNRAVGPRNDKAPIYKAAAEKEFGS